MKSIKTYAIEGLLEWHGTVKAGAIKMKVSFTNGTTTAYGVAPATFITKDELTQFVIENSDKFKSGRIKLVSTTELPEESDVKKSTGGTEKAKQEPKSSPSDPGKSSVKTVKVADKREAVEWLKENFPTAGYTAAKLRSEEVFTEVCKERGVVFDYTA